jgi:hypothetical protein
MGAGGAAMAVAVADMVLMSENLLRIPAAIQQGRLTRAIILENVIFSIAAKLIAIILASIGVLELWHAILFDIGSLIVVICNGCRPLYCEKMFAQYSVPQEKKEERPPTIADVESQKKSLLAAEISPFRESAMPRPSVRNKRASFTGDVDGFRASSFSSLLITEETGVVEIIAERESTMGNRGRGTTTFVRPSKSSFQMENLRSY